MPATAESVLVADPGPADAIDAMKVHRIWLDRDQGLQAWEPGNVVKRGRMGADSLI